MLKGYVGGSGDAPGYAEYTRVDVFVDKEKSLKTQLKLYGIYTENARIEITILGDEMSMVIANFSTSGQNESVNEFPFPFSVIQMKIRRIDSNIAESAALFYYIIA